MSIYDPLQLPRVTKKSYGYISPPKEYPRNIPGSDLENTWAGISLFASILPTPLNLCWTTFGAQTMIFQGALFWACGVPLGALELCFWGAPWNHSWLQKLAPDWLNLLVSNWTTQIISLNDSWESLLDHFWGSGYDFRGGTFLSFWGSPWGPLGAIFWGWQHEHIRPTAIAQGYKKIIWLY